MKQVWIIFFGLMAALLFYGRGSWQPEKEKTAAKASPTTYRAGSQQQTPGPPEWRRGKDKADWPAYSGTVAPRALADTITAYGLRQLGTPYLPAGTTRAGFDCSGFVYHIFGRYGVELPHASALLAHAGKAVPLDKVKRGDLLIFTGPDGPEAQPGHVGVVISRAGQSPAFVHASSAGGVKISKVVGTGYEQRFLQARRVL